MRLLAIDDSPPVRRHVFGIGVVWSASGTEGSVEGILVFPMKKDGSDAARNLIRAVKKSRFKPHLKLLLTHGSTMAGLNILDVEALCEKLGMPWIGVLRKKPSGTILQALEKAYSSQRLISRKRLLLEKAGAFYAEGKIHFQFHGMTEKEARKHIRSFGGFPEPLRLAHLIASAVVRGESHGQA